MTSFFACWVDCYLIFSIWIGFQIWGFTQYSKFPFWFFSVPGIEIGDFADRRFGSWDFGLQRFSILVFWFSEFRRLVFPIWFFVQTCENIMWDKLLSCLCKLIFIVNWTTRFFQFYLTSTYLPFHKRQR